jgi:hypothetical protein
MKFSEVILVVIIFLLILSGIGIVLYFITMKKKKGECQKDADCATGKCSSGQCVYIQCTGVPPDGCPANFYCGRDGICVPGAIPFTCNQDSQCGFHQGCLLSRCLDLQWENRYVQSNGKYLNIDDTGSYLQDHSPSFTFFLGKNAQLYARGQSGTNLHGENTIFHYDDDSLQFGGSAHFIFEDGKIGVFENNEKNWLVVRKSDNVVLFSSFFTPPPAPAIFTLDPPI